MFCPNCGLELDEGSRFCPECGTEVEGGNDGGDVADVTRMVDDGLDFGDMADDKTFDVGASNAAFRGVASNRGYGGSGANTAFVASDTQATGGGYGAGGSIGTSGGYGGTVQDQASSRGGGKTVAAVAIIAVVAILIIAAVIFLVIKPNPSATHTVQYETYGGTAVAAVEVEEGAQVTTPSNPTKSGYTFEGWYSNPECTDEVTFPFAVDEDLVLYAKWEEVEEANPTPSAPSSTSSSASTTPQSSGNYIISNSASTYLTRSDLSGYSNDELAIAMNEIWARHGRLFKNNWLQSYFNGQSWYTGSIPADDFLSRYTPTAIEDANSKLISTVLTERGYDVNKAHPN